LGMLYNSNLITVYAKELAPRNLQIDYEGMESLEHEPIFVELNYTIHYLGTLITH